MSKEVTPEEFKQAFPQLANLFDEVMGDKRAWGDSVANVSQRFGFTLTGGTPVYITLQVGEDGEGDE